MSLLNVNSITKEYKDFSLKNISFELPAGYIMGYVGRNGAGKTSTLNIISGMSRQKSGIVTIDGCTIQSNEQEYINSIGYIGDESFFPKEFKIGAVEMVLKSFYPTFSVQKFRGYVEEWKLPRDKKIEQFSRGMKVKLMFACVLSRETKLLVLDEATNGLDPVVRKEIMQILQNYVEDGEHSILFSTHILNDLEQIADYVVFIENGEILINDAKDDLMEKFLIVKGGPTDLTAAVKGKLIGVEQNSMGFEALINSDDSVSFDNRYFLEKPTIDQIILHQIAEQTRRVVGRSIA